MGHLDVGLDHILKQSGETDVVTGEIKGGHVSLSLKVLNRFLRGKGRFRPFPPADCLNPDPTTA